MKYLFLLLPLLIQADTKICVFKANELGLLQKTLIVFRIECDGGCMVYGNNHKEIIDFEKMIRCDKLKRILNENKSLLHK